MNDSSLFAPSPKPWTPHEYQQRAIRFGLSQGAAGFFLDPGLGKSSVVLAILKILKAKSLMRSALIVAPLRVCYTVWPGEIRKWLDFNELTFEILHGPKKDEAVKRKADIYLLNPDGFPWFFSTKRTNADVLVVDECFVAGTMIDTPDGKRAIEVLSVGDSVTTEFGPRKIKRVIKKQSKSLVRFVLSNGVTVTCTTTHPVFTDYGWIQAQFLEGLNVAYYDHTRMPNLPDKLHNDCLARCTWQRPDLLNILQVEAGVEKYDRRNQSKNLKSSRRQHTWKTFLEQGKKMAGRVSSIALANRKGTGPRSNTEDGQRNWADRSRDFITESFAQFFSVELCSTDTYEKREWVPHLLQTGLCRSAEDGGHRSRRQLTQSVSAKNSRQQKRTVFNRTWVVSVESAEQNGIQDVWNLEVEGCPHYFANGVLVHNCTMLKHTNTQRFKLLKPHLNRFRRRFILTGTPASNGYLDLFGQFYLLDGGNALGRYITHYRTSYFYQTGFGGYEWKLMPGMEEKIQERISPLVMQLSAQDYLKLPELVENVVYVDLPTKAQKVYNELEEEFLVELAGETITAATAATASMKLRQISNGFLYNEDHKGIDIHEAKLEACKTLVDELNGKPVFIAYEFEHDRNRLMKLFGKDTPYLGGGVTPRRSQEIEAAWNRKEISILLAHPRSAGHGLNLQGGGSTLIWFGLTWDLELYEQTIKRIHRQGQQAEKVFVHYILARQTIDEAVYKALRGKARTQSRLLEALKKYGMDKRRHVQTSRP